MLFMALLKDNCIICLNEEQNVYSNYYEVLDNGDTGFFVVGNVLTPKKFIGKKVNVFVKLAGDL